MKGNQAMVRADMLTIIATLHYLNLNNLHFSDGARNPKPDPAGCVKAANEALKRIENVPNKG